MQTELVRLTLGEVLAILGGQSVLWIAVVTVGGWLLKSRIDNSIRSEYGRAIEKLRYDYNTQLENLRHQLRLRHNSMKVAECLAAYWYPNTPPAERIAALSWELSLSLPAPQVRHLTEVFVNRPEDFKELLIAVRKHLHGEDDTLTADQILHLEPEKIENGGK